MVWPLHAPDGMGRLFAWWMPVLLAGCVSFEPGAPSDPTPEPTGGGGSGSGSGSGGNTALERRQAFDQDVYPILMDKCSGCHAYDAPIGTSLNFVELVDPAKAYDLMKSFSALLGQPLFSLLLQQPTFSEYSPDEEAAIEHWIALERSP